MNIEAQLWRIVDLERQIQKLIDLVQKLEMWSAALNPVVSMLLEKMNDASIVESDKVGEWLDLAE